MLGLQPHLGTLGWLSLEGQAVGGVGGPVAVLLFLLCLPVWVSPPSLTVLLSGLLCV